MSTPVSQNWTYDKLLKDIPNYAGRSDALFLAQIPSLITLAENRLATEMKQQGFQAVMRGNFDPSAQLPKPAFWRETISLSYVKAGKIINVYNRSLEYLKHYWPSPSATDEPKFYADYNIKNFYVAPTPEAAYEFELVYYARLDPLSKEHQENWMTLNAPQALFYACLLESALFRGNPADIAKWTAQYQEAVGSLLGENKERLADRNSGVRPQ